MGLYQGSVTLSRYKVVGSKARLKLGRLNDLIEPHRAKKLRLEGVEHEEITGWARPLGEVTGESVANSSGAGHWDMSDCQIGDGLLLRVQIERRKVPASLFQMVFKQRLLDLAKKRGKPAGRPERLKLKEDLKGELTRKTLPALSFVDAIWRDEAGDITLFSAGERARQAFETLFNKTFAEALGLQLVRIEPPLLGLDGEAWTDSKIAGKALAQLSLAVPTAFGGETPAQI